MAQQELRNSLKAGHRLHWYRIESILGQGGFGITYLAYDTNLDQHVAIKEYLPMDLAVRDSDNSVHPASDSNQERYQWGLDRFISEARTLAKFKHPAIVRVLSVFEDHNTAYMVMEYELGESLQFVLDGRKTLDEDELMPILASLLDGLEIIHATGFIHRDIKPANIYLREDKSPVLLDFGSARQALGEQTKSLTSIVSPGYAPFEQYYSKSDRQGPWTDIYSLAATMYRAISGVMPMNAIDRSDAILRAERDVFVSAGEIGADRYSVGFMRALDHALHFSEKKRPQTIAEWRAELGIETRNSAPISRPASSRSLREKSSGGEAPPSNEVETLLAEPVMPNVQNIDAVASTAGAESSPNSSFPAGSSSGVKRWWIGAMVAALLLLSVGFWLQFSTQQGSYFEPLKTALTSLLSSSSGARLERLMAQGDRALAADRAYQPLAGSALEFYRQVLEISPTHSGALQGMALISAAMLPVTETAIAAGDLELASQLLETMRSLPGLRQVLQSLEQAYAMARAELATNLVQAGRIEEFLDDAAIDIAQGRLLHPRGNNALLRYRAIQLLDPENIQAKRGITAIVARLTEQYETALAASDYELASRRLDEIKPLQTDSAQFETLSEALEQARTQDAKATARNTKIASLLRDAALDLKANRLATPSSGNAMSRYNVVLELDPNNREATAGLVKVTQRYVELANYAIRNQQFDSALEYISRAKSLNAATSTVTQLSAQLKTAQAQRRDENAARTLAQAQQRLADEARQRQETERLRLELEAALEATAVEKRRRQELEAKRLFELEQSKQEAIVASAIKEEEAAQRATLVVEFDGFSDQLEIYGLKEREVRADIESRLRALGYNIVLHHEANRSSLTRLFLIRFRANLNSASGVFSYAASLSLYDHVPVVANSAGKSGRNPIWTKGMSGVAVQTQLRRVRDEYNQTMRLFHHEVGRAPGRL